LQERQERKGDRGGRYGCVGKLAVVGMVDDLIVESLQRGLVGDDEGVEALHVGLLGARQGVVSQVLEHLGHQDQLPVCHLTFPKNIINCIRSL
jgi:hypothetical protein